MLLFVTINIVVCLQSNRLRRPGMERTAVGSILLCAEPCYTHTNISSARNDSVLPS